MCRLLLG